MTETQFTRRAAMAAPFAAGAALAALALPAGAAAPMLGASAGGFRRFRIGAMEATTLHDGYITLGGPYPIFGEDQFPEDVAELAEANRLPADRMAISFTVTLLNTGAELILFDAGNGALRRPDAGKLLGALAAAGYAPEQIDVVVITHMHPDHIGGLMEAGAPAFPNARYVAGAREFDFFSQNAPENLAPLIESNVRPLAEKMSFVEPGAAVVSGVEAVGAFGHTPGHMAWHIESEGARLMITADAANHFVASLQRPDWHVRFDMDKAAAAATRRALFGMIAADRIPFVGYHMPGAALGYVEEIGEGFRYIPETYQLAL